ncbi:hypothetical protein B9T54_01795 [Leptospira borgpetersenii serovar Hardjo-bovis]|nr:hypothetical protein B9T54_01795 [Leptospira borgpetersenii serovar Hardjo-bovis]
MWKLKDWIEILTAHPKTRGATLRERTRFRFLLCRKGQAARFCPSFGTEPYIEFTLNNIQFL